MLADVFRKAMEQRGWSIRHLAARSGVDYTTIHNILSGRRKDPAFSTVGQIAWPLQLDLWALLAEQFLGEVGSMPDSSSGEAPYPETVDHGQLTSMTLLTMDSSRP